jgi:hypothetical protein
MCGLKADELEEQTVLQKVSKNELRKSQESDPVVGLVMQRLGQGLKPKPQELGDCSAKTRVWLQEWKKLRIDDG